MMRNMIIFALAAFLAACGENTETTVTVEDQSGNTTQITIKEEVKKAPKESTNTMAGHPLAKYNAPEDANIMLYFPMMIGFCGKDYTEERCDMGVKEFQRRAEMIGRNIEEKYIRNPAFWEFQLKVEESSKKHKKAMYDLPMAESYKELAAFGNEKDRRLEAFKKGTY